MVAYINCRFRVWGRQLSKAPKEEIIAVHRAPDSEAKSSQKTVEWSTAEHGPLPGETGLLAFPELQLLW